MASHVRTREWDGVDYYAELGVDRNALPATIDDAFRRQAKALHPDRNPGDRDAEERFKGVTVAYGVLRDPSTRGAYDDFRRRVNEGSLYRRPSGARSGPTDWMRAPSRSVRPPRRPLPAWLRFTLGGILIAGGVAAGLVALLVEVRGPTAGDTVLAVQITLGIMAAKLLACGVIVMAYPRLRARWHHPPATPA